MEPIVSAQTLLIADTDLKITEAGESCCIGPSRAVQTTALDDLVGRPLPDSIPGLDPADVRDACRTILSGERLPEGTYAYRKIHVLWEPEPERDVVVISPRRLDGRIVGLTCRISRTFLRHPQVDILSPAGYRAMVENCMEFMVLIDPLGFHTYVSPVIEVSLGALPGDVPGIHISEILHPDDIESSQEAFGRVVRGEPVTDHHYRLVPPNGPMRHMVISGQPIRIDGSARLVGTCKDVTEIMELRQKLQARHEALAAISNIVLTLARKGGLSDALHAALNEILAFLQLPMGGIHVLNSDGSEFIADIIIGTENPPISPQVFMDQLDRLCPEPGEVQIVRDLTSDTRMNEIIRSALLSAGVRSFVLARLQSMQGQQHAYMALPIPAGYTLSVEQTEFLNLATGILGPAIENAVLQGELADRANRLAMLERMALSINSGLDARSIFAACQSGLRDLIELDEVCLVVFDANENADIYRFHGEGCIVHDRKKLAREQMEAFRDIRESRAWSGPGGAGQYPTEHRERDLSTGSGAISPLTYKGTVIGLLKIWSHRENAFRQREVAILQAVAEHLAIAVANARLYEAEHARTLELEALGREMQHRIKNNLQSIAGLLSISCQDGAQGTRALERCLGQVRAISTVHTLLTPRYASSGIQLRRLLMEVARASVTAAGRSQEIDVTVQGDNCKLSPDTAVAVGVIANELISNSIEHGLSGRDDGEINIRTSVEPPHTVIEVWDNGSGLPAGYKLSNRTSSGLGLVSSLVEYGLHGQFTITRSESGTLARIEF